MKNDDFISLSHEDTEVDFGEIYDWWDDDYPKKRKKKRKKKKHKKKKAKQSKRELKHRLIEKSADIALRTASDIVKMYAESKLRSSN